MKKSFLNIFSVIVVSAFVFAFLPVISAHAASNVSVTFGPEFALNAQNMAPGDTAKGTFTVENLTDETQDLAIKVRVVQGIWQTLTNNVEEKLFIKIKKPSGTFATMPNGTDQQLLSELDGSPFKFSSISGPDGTTKTFELWVTFDVNAGNEYQGKKVIFDIVAGIDAEESNGDGDGDGDNNNDGGAPGPSSFTGFFTAGGTVGGATAGPTGEITGGGEGAPGEVQGEETTEECIPIKWYVFAIVLGLYILIMLYNLFYKFKESEDIRWFWEALYTILGLAIWYFFDRCRTNTWFIYAIIISGFILYLLYLYLFKKKDSSSDVK